MVVQVADKKDLTVKFQEAGNKLVVIDFYATWCGPCKIIAPKIEELEKQMTNVVFLKVDVDENEEIAAEYEITAMPTFVFIKNGNKLEAFSGANFDKLKAKCEELKPSNDLEDSEGTKPKHSPEIRSLSSEKRPSLESIKSKNNVQVFPEKVEGTEPKHSPEKRSLSSEKRPSLESIKSKNNVQVIPEKVEELLKEKESDPILI